MTDDVPAFPDFHHERRLGGIVCGIDEVGRGPWAGPVVAAALIWPEGVTPPPGIRDSKRLSAKRREGLAETIAERAIIAIGRAEVEEIDRLNILKATFLAMQRAVLALGFKPDTALVDGNRAPPLPCRVETLVGGDNLSLSIAAASIVAKVYRDRLMGELETLYPGYGFARHMGYGTAAHREALQRLGVTPCHRTSFRPIKALTQKGLLT